MNMKKRMNRGQRIVTEGTPALLLAFAAQLPHYFLDELYQNPAESMVAAHAVDYTLTTVAWLIFVYYIVWRVAAALRRMDQQR